MGIEERVIKWIVIFYIFFLVTVSVVLIGSALKPLLSDNWDLLAFVGAIIGGLITFLGVKYTLDKQKEKELIDLFPDKCLNGIVVREFCAKLERFLHDEVINGNGKREYFESIGEYRKEFGEMYIKSSKVGGKFYLMARYALETFDEFAILEELSFRNIQDYTQEDFIRHRNIIQDCINEIDSEIDSIERKFRDLITEWRFL